MRREGVTTALAPTDSAAERRSAEIESFLRDHGQRLLGGLVLLTGSRHTAEDALQEALAKAWNRRDLPIENLAAWITVVATNQARSGWRRGQAEQRALQRVGGRAAPAPQATAEPDDALHRALQGLSPREREVAVLHYVHDQSVAQAASAMGVSTGTVKTLLSRARAHLAEQLDLEGGAA